MEVIPAIDIIKGKVVRLTRGDYQLKKIYATEPVAIAELFEKAGFERMHLVDLEGSQAGTIKNWQTIESIAKNTLLKLQVGGGISSLADVKRLFALGVDRAIIGSMAVEQPDLLKQLLRQFPSGKIVVDVAVKNQTVYFHGWQEKAPKNLSAFLKELIALGVATVVLTDVERDGALRGPNLALYRQIVQDFPALAIIASGGVAQRDDLVRLGQIGVKAVIVGKAIYEKKLSLTGLRAFEEPLYDNYY